MATASLIPIHKAYRSPARLYHTAPTCGSKRQPDWTYQRFGVRIRIQRPQDDPPSPWKLPPRMETQDRPSPEDDGVRVSRLVPPRPSPPRDKPPPTSPPDKTRPVQNSRLSPPQPRPPPPKEKPKPPPEDSIVPPIKPNLKVGQSQLSPPKVVRPPRLKSPSGRAEAGKSSLPIPSGKSSLPVSTKYSPSPPTEILRSSSAGAQRASRPRSNIPTRGEVCRSSAVSVELSPAPSSPPLLPPRPFASPPPIPPAYLPPPPLLHTPFSTTNTEDSANTTMLRRTANEYLIANQVRPRENALAQIGSPLDSPSGPETFIVSQDLARDSALLPTVLPDDKVQSIQAGQKEECTQEAQEQKSPNDDPGRENNVASVDNDEYVRPLGDQTEEVIATDSCPVIQPEDGGGGGGCDAEQDILGIHPKGVNPEDADLGIAADEPQPLEISEPRNKGPVDPDSRRRSEEAGKRGEARPLEPIYESLAAASESREAGQPAAPRGQSSAVPRAQRARQYWPEDQICSSLTRQQRQAASKGLSLPAGRASASLFNKSFSLGGYYQAEDSPQGPKGLGYLKTSGKRLLQRLSSVRRSLSSRHQVERLPPLPVEVDEDRVFFRGFSAASKEEYGVNLVTSKEASAGPGPRTSVYSPTAPPRKRRLHSGRGSRWVSSSWVGRSLSFNDAERIAEAVERGDSEQVEALYPDFPRSSPIYAVIDRSKKRRRRDKSQEVPECKDPLIQACADHAQIQRAQRASSWESQCHTATDQTFLTSTTASSDSMVKSHSATNSPVTNKEFDSNYPSHSKLKKKKQKKLKGVSIDNFNLEEDPERLVTSSLRNLPGSRGRLSARAGGSVQCVHTVGWADTLDTAARSHRSVPQLSRPQKPEVWRSGREAAVRGDRGPHAEEAADSSGQCGLRWRSGGKEEEELRIILALADERLEQAGSLISSVRRDRGGADGKSGLPLASDIQADIGRLEETRERIGDAIEIYQAVQERRGEVAVRPPTSSSPSVTFNAKVNVEHRVREAVITRTSLGGRSRRSGLEDDRRGGQVWEGSGGLPPGDQGERKLGRSSRPDSPDSSSSSPLAGRRQSAVWYDGDEESSDYRLRKPSDQSEKPKSRILSLSSSFKKAKRTSGRKKRSSKEEIPSSRGSFQAHTNGNSEGAEKEVGDIVADILAPMRIRQETTNRLERVSMGNDISSAEEARPNPCAPPPVPDAEGSSSASNSSSSFLTAANSERQSSASPVKRRESPTQPKVRSVSRLVARFEQYDVTDGRGSVISSHSGSTDSGEQGENTFVRSSVSTSSVSTAGDAVGKALKHEKKTYMVAREIMSSEKVYVEVLKMITEDFREYVANKSEEIGSDILPPDVLTKIFSNIPQLMMFNSELLKDFEDRIENWDSLKKIADVLVKKGPFLRLYATYLSDFEATTNLFEECCSRYPCFGAAVRGFESMPKCGNLKLKMHMLKPVQRLPQYKMLLEDYLKHQGEDSIDFDDTTEALRIVSDAAAAANNNMKAGDQLQNMLKLQERVGDFEVIRPGRELLKEGEMMKISRSEVVPRYFILLSDCLLYCHYQGPWAGDITRLKVGYCLKLDQLSLSVPSNEEFQEEFSITSNIRSVTVRATDVDVRNDWLEAINSAIEELQNRQLSFFPTEEGAARNTLSAEESVGEVAPVWVPDQRVAFCQGCNTEFKLTVRRHHCRCCGGVMCSRCSSNKAPIKYLKYERVRVCNSCFERLKIKYQNEPELQSRFKKKESSTPVGAYIPNRLREAADSQEVQMSGFLRWRKGKGAGWKKNWFVLKDRVLFTFKAVNDKVATDTKPVLGWTLETLSDKNFELYEGEPAGLVFLLTHPGQDSLAFCAENDNLAEKWMTALREATTMD